MLRELGAELLYLRVFRSSFRRRVHVFTSSSLTVARQIFIKWRINSLFSGHTLLSFHSAGRYFRRRRRRVRPIRRVLRRFWWYRKTSLFTLASVTLRFGFVIGSAGALSLVVSRLIKKHNRH